MTRTYHGTPSELEVIRAADAEALAMRGYFPSSQNYVQGNWSALAWVLAVLAFLILIGLLIFIYMIATKPAGTLNVIYERRVAAPTIPVAPTAPLVFPVATTQAVPAAAAGPNVEERLATLERMRAAGTVTEEEYVSKRGKILDDL